jgi:hypothetical protein
MIVETTTLDARREQHDATVAKGAKVVVLSAGGGENSRE